MMILCVNIKIGDKITISNFYLILIRYGLPQLYKAYGPAGDEGSFCIPETRATLQTMSGSQNKSVERGSD